MRNSLKAVLFAPSLSCFAGLHAETHQHGDMNTASTSVRGRSYQEAPVIKNIDEY